MRKKIYTIYDICGNNESNLRLLVHIEDADIPGDWQFYESAIVKIVDSNFFVEYLVNEWLTSMWQSPTGHIYACSMNGKIHHYDLGNWKVINLNGNYSLNDIWGFNDTEIYCCGLDDVLFQKTIGTWQRNVVNLKDDLLKIRGISSNHMYMIGQAGSLFYFNGIIWEKIDSPTNCYLQSILCVSFDEIYICGENGALFKISQSGWERIDDVEFDYWALAKFQDKIIVAGGEEGLFWIEENTLIPFNKNIEVTGLQVIGDLLFAFDINVINKYDGKNWTETRYNFELIANK